MSKRKKILASVGVLMLVAMVIGGGTFAAFNASTTNAANAFATGTVVLSNTVDATTCYSTGAGTNTDTNANSTGCAQVIDVNTQKPGDSVTETVTLGNEGTLDGTLAFSVGSCTTSDASGETYHGTGDLCSALTIDVDGNASSFGGSGSAGNLNAGDTSDVDVTVSLPSGAGNTMQGRVASFDITWTLTQA